MEKSPKPPRKYKLIYIKMPQIKAEFVWNK